MKWSFASVGLIMLGLFGIVIIMLFNDITVSNEQDYYTLKYATEASMLESVDVTYYRLTGEIKISQEKFVENFARRFTETSTFGQGNYGIEYYQIIEYPAKVSLRIYDKTSGYNIYTYNSDVETTQADIVNELSAILDGNEVDNYKDGYEVTDVKGINAEVGSENECMLTVAVGKNKKNGNEVYRCIFDDGSRGYREISGSAVAEADVVFEATTIDEEGMYKPASTVLVGHINGCIDEACYVYDVLLNGKHKEYQNASGEIVYANSFTRFSPNKGQCISTEPVGKVKTPVGKINEKDIGVNKCNLSNGSFEYQDVYGHRIATNNIIFN